MNQDKKDQAKHDAPDSNSAATPRVTGGTMGDPAEAHNVDRSQDDDARLGQGLRRKPPTEDATVPGSEGDAASDDRSQHTKATLPPGNHDPDRNTM